MRQELPWVPVEKQYRFDTDEGSAFLIDLFRGRSQLLVYHLMLGPDYTAACPSCSAIADGFNGFFVHLANHDVMLWAVSRAPLLKLQAYRRRMGWSFPWASSFGSDFNFDYGAGFTEDQQRNKGILYNFRHEPPLPANPSRQSPHAIMCGVDDGVVYHTYSTYGRGVDGLWGMYQWLDRDLRAVTRTVPGGVGTTNTHKPDEAKKLRHGMPSVSYLNRGKLCNARNTSQRLQIHLDV